MLDTSEKDVLLVEEEDGRGRREASVVTDRVEQRQTVVHGVLGIQYNSV